MMKRTSDWECAGTHLICGRDVRDWLIKNLNNSLGLYNYCVFDFHTKGIERENKKVPSLKLTNISTLQYVKRSRVQFVKSEMPPICRSFLDVKCCGKIIKNVRSIEGNYLLETVGVDCGFLLLVAKCILAEWKGWRHPSEIAEPVATQSFVSCEN